MFTRRFFQVVAATAFAAAMPGIVCAQDVFDQAKNLYLEAAYEDALALLDTRGPTGSADVHLYRALCLLALGRAAEADAAIARSIEADPLAGASRPDVSPRVVTMLNDARRRLLPEIARRRVADGRLAYQQGDKTGAVQRFEAAVKLLDDPALTNQAELADLRTLASGFLDLIRAQTAMPAAPPAPAAATNSQTPAASQAPAAVPPPAAAATAAPRPGTPAGTAAAPESAPATAAPVISRPTPISQPIPVWRPPDPSWRNRELRGSMLLSIDATGRVTAVEMEQSIYPGYDRLLIEAARTWRYTPAIRDGKPTTSQLIVPILVRAQ
jgi:tetratricopeptide (TPR) repeat protein